MKRSEFVQSGGRIFYRRQSCGRILTAIYTRSKEDNTIRYAATVWTPGVILTTKTKRGVVSQHAVQEEFNKDQNFKYAYERYLNTPVVIEDQDCSAKARQSLVHKAISENGCFTYKTPEPFNRERARPSGLGMPASI